MGCWGVSPPLNSDREGVGQTNPRNSPGDFHGYAEATVMSHRIEVMKAFRTPLVLPRSERSEPRYLVGVQGFAFGIGIIAHRAPGFARDKLLGSEHRL